MKARGFGFLLILLLLAAVPITAQEEPITQRNAPPDPANITLVEVASGFNRPLYLTHAGDGSGRLFIVEQGGKIKIWKEGAVLNLPFLDVTNLLTRDVNSGGYTERGLLGLAFHPNYAENGRFFINYTNADGATVVSSFRVSPGSPDLADPTSENILLTIPQPFPNHNGGHMDFGPDGYLYISIGDGGAAGDPLATGQNPDDLLGSILRIDVDVEAGYAIPADNPFVNGGGAPEVWSYGLRNVWRFSFDRATGDLYLADVGQGQWEEVNFQPADSPGGENYGWRAFEGSRTFSGGVDAAATTLPIAEYGHSDGSCSVTGGYVYRGTAIADLQGVYLYGDWCSGFIFTAYRDESDTWRSNFFTRSRVQISSFGEDEAGELYVLDYNGGIFRITQSQ